MKVFVLFGSKSDAYIYEPLKSRLLAEGHEVDFRFLSVHRSPELLNRELESLEADCIVAGAGLAAHLPGVLASKSLLPVFGIPCAPALGGLDALLSILQMPFGIPVLTSAPDNYAVVVDAITRWSQAELRFVDEPVHLVVERHKATSAPMAPLLEKAKNIADKVGMRIPVQNQLVSGAVNVVLEEIDPRDPTAPLASAGGEAGLLRIHVPVLRDEAYRDPGSALHILEKMRRSGGLWVGLNNIGNGILAALQLANGSGAQSAVLTNAKKGYIHLYG